MILRNPQLPSVERAAADLAQATLADYLLAHAFDEPRSYGKGYGTDLNYNTYTVYTRQAAESKTAADTFSGTYVHQIPPERMLTPEYYEDSNIPYVEGRELWLGRLLTLHVPTGDDIHQLADIQTVRSGHFWQEEHGGWSVDRAQIATPEKLGAIAGEALTRWHTLRNVWLAGAASVMRHMPNVPDTTVTVLSQNDTLHTATFGGKDILDMLKADQQGHRRTATGRRVTSLAVAVNEILGRG